MEASCKSVYKPVERHSREGGYPDSFKIFWIPAFAGMTGLADFAEIMGALLSSMWRKRGFFYFS
jgi:hypothetical protein